MINRFNIKKYTIGHPFGEDMKNNIISVKKMVKDFLSIASRDLDKTEHVVLICMGSSGAIVSTIFYNALQKKYDNLRINICHVKKENEEAHGERVSGFYTKGKTLYIWVDDFIESGETIDMCIGVIREFITKKGITFSKGLFKFDYVVCSTIDATKCKIKDIEKTTNNIVYNYL